MVTKSLIVLLSVACVVAQTPTSTVSVPACLASCVQPLCGATDLQCICVTHLSDISSCVINSCSQTDLASAQALAAQECGAFSPSSVSSEITSTTVLSVSSEISSTVVLSVSSAVESLQSHVSGVSSRITSAAGSFSSAKSFISGPSPATVPPSSEAATTMNFGGVLLAMLAVIVGFVAL